MPSISIIIPAFNEAENIGECLKSLQAQIRRPEEIIVVDNESEDDTMEIARSFGVRTLSFPRPYKRHGNIGLVRQHGTEAATGDIIVSTDADCTYPVDWLQKIEAHFNSNPKLAVLGGPVISKDRDLWNDFICGLGNFPRSYAAGWGIPYFLAANTSFTKDAFMLTEGYKGAAGHGPVEEWIVSFRLSRVGEWMWDDELVCFTRVPESWRVYTAAIPLTMAPLGVWAGLATLQGGL